MQSWDGPDLAVRYLTLHHVMSPTSPSSDLFQTYSKIWFINVELFGVDLVMYLLCIVLCVLLDVAVIS